jgi:hypothetical protein
VGLADSGRTWACTEARQDRYYYRVECPSLAFYEIYYDATVNWWVLDRVID